MITAASAAALACAGALNIISLSIDASAGKGGTDNRDNRKAQYRHSFRIQPNHFLLILKGIDIAGDACGITPSIVLFSLFAGQQDK